MEFLDEIQELGVGTTTESVHKFLIFQRDLFHGQISQLQDIVIRQCRLTGVNPLSQEMAAGALSMKIGKRPRDLLSPKIVKYMQMVFSVKDAVSKKESRDISALYGVTPTQVRDFFSNQRSRVRKYVRISREKALQNDVPVELNEGAIETSDRALAAEPLPLNTIDPASTSSSCHDEPPIGMDATDTYFVDSIFRLMRDEETFSGQIRLMEWILKIQCTEVLSWFLSKGGVMILVTWLSQAATEEQTSVLFVILKLLCHLPLHEASTVQMSAILQGVNKLRFYRSQAISKKARILLSQWSKLFGTSLAMKKHNAATSSSYVHNEELLKQSINEVIDDQSKLSNSILSVEESQRTVAYSESFRKVGSLRAKKLLPVSSGDRKLVCGVASMPMKGRRKVQLVEQPCQKESLRGPYTTTTTTKTTTNMNHRRPMSTDDIQKAKMRARFAQHKNGKVPAPTPVVVPSPTLAPAPTHTSVGGLPVASTPISCEEPKRVQTLKSEPMDSPESDGGEPAAPFKRQWVVPPVYKVEEMWSVCCGEDSKEVEFQKKRILREPPVFYPTLSHVPPRPNDPWDVEVDYDDSLTPIVPTHQLPDSGDTHTTNVVAPPPPVPPSASGMLEPDFELLAILLRNPELVFALTSGQQGGGLSGEDTFRLLNFIRNGALGQLLPPGQAVPTLGAPTVPSGESVNRVGGRRGLEEERWSEGGGGSR